MGLVLDKHYLYNSNLSLFKSGDFQNITMENKPTYIIVHHLGGTTSNPNFDSSNLTFEQVNLDHKERWYFKSQLGFFCGYHYFLDKKGIITQARNENEEAAHCKQMNLNSIGIGIAGNFDISFPTKEQEESLNNLIKGIKERRNIPNNNIVPHRHFWNTDCYGLKLNDFWAYNLINQEELKTKLSLLEKLLQLYVKLLNLLKQKGLGRIDDRDDGGIVII